MNAHKYKNIIITLNAMTSPKPKPKPHRPQQQAYSISPMLPPQKGLFTFYAEQQQVDQYSSYAEKERIEMEKLKEREKQREKSRQMLELERRRYQEMRDREIEEQRIIDMKVWKIRGKERERNQLRDVLRDMKIKKNKNRESAHINNQSINQQKQHLSKSYKDKQQSKTKKNKTKSKHKNKERSKSKSKIKKHKHESSKLIKSTQNLNVIQQMNKNQQAFNSNTINFKNQSEEVRQQIKQQIVSNYNTKQRQHQNMQQYIAEQIQQINQKYQQNPNQDPCAQFLRKIRQRKLHKSPNTSLSVVDMTKKSVEKQSDQNKQSSEDKFNQLLYPKNSLQYELNNKLYQSKDKNKLRIKSHINQKQRIQQGVITTKKDHRKMQDSNQKNKMEQKDQIFDKRTYQKKIRSLSTRKRLYTELPKQHGQTFDMNVKQNFYGNIQIQSNKNKKITESAPPTSKFTTNPGYGSNVNLINMLSQSQNPNTHQALITEINNPISPPTKQFIGNQLRNYRIRTYEDQLQYNNNDFHQKQKYMEEETYRAMRERDQLEFSQHLRTIRNSQRVNLMSNRNIQISVGSYDDNHSYTRKIISQSLKLPIMRNVRLSKQLQKISEVAQKKINQVVPIKRYDSIKSKKSTKKILKSLVPSPGSSSMPKKNQVNQPSLSQPQPDRKRLVAQTSAQQMQSVDKQQRIALIDLSKHDLISNENQKSDLSWKERKKMLFKKLGLKL